MNYQFTTPDNKFVQCTRDDGTSYLFHVDNARPDYLEYIASGQTVQAYVEPAAPAALTAQERLEDATGLTVDQIKAVLGI